MKSTSMQWAAALVAALLGCAPGANGPAAPGDGGGPGDAGAPVTDAAAPSDAAAPDGGAGGGAVDAAAPQGDVELSLYFSNAKLGDYSKECREVFEVKRRVPPTQAVARAALTELLRGPTPEERAAGYESSIPAGTALRGVRVEGGVAIADFSEDLNRAAGSCTVQLARREIERTLSQFPTVKSVMIEVMGKREPVLQP